MGPPVRLLHVDDDRELLARTATVLRERFGWLEVVTEPDPAAALERVERGEVDCVVSDHDEGTDGLALLRAVRERDDELPVILFTGGGSEAVAGEAIRAGVTDYLTKGTDGAERLAARVEAAVSPDRAEADRGGRGDYGATLSAFATFALSGPPAVDLHERAVGVVAETLDVASVRLLERDAADDRLLPRADAGWPGAAAARTGAVPAAGTLAGEVGRREGVVFHPDLGAAAVEADGAPADAEVVGGGGVAVGEEWGVLLVYATEPRELTSEETAFLEALADMLAAALAATLGVPDASRPGLALDEAFERSPVGTLVLDADGEVTWANDAFAGYFGLAREDVVGRGGDELVHESLSPAVTDGEALRTAALEAYGTGEQVVRLECEVTPAADRAGRWLQYWSQPVTEGAYAGGRIEHYYDISDRKQLEVELERNLDALGELYEVSASGLPFVEKVERLLEYGCTHLGVDMGALNHVHDGKQDTVVAAADDLPGSVPLEEAYCKRTIESSGLVTIEDAAGEGWGGDPAYEAWGWACYIGGKVVVGDETYGTICFADEEPRERTFSEFDRTFVRLLARWVSYELDSERTQAALARENDRLDQFASVVSHDLRNPLSVAMGYLDVAREEPTAATFDRIGRALDRMDGIIDDALAVARLGNRVTERRELSLDDLAAEAWASVEAPGATLTVHEDVTVSGDEDRLLRVLENLFRNAVEHGGASVTVTVGAVDDGFYVADDGPGIPESKREQVFTTGFTTAEEGTGFGLAVVRAAAEAHGWTVSVTEGDAGGARFEFRPDSIDVR